MSKVRYIMLIGSLCLALILSAFHTAPAFADESAPPSSETSEETTNQETESAATEEIVEDTESTTPEEEAATPPADEEADSASESESASVAEVIESFPEDTTLVVVDENGEALPLASEEAAEVIQMADPRWCPAGATPPSGCSPAFDYFVGTGGLLEWLLINQPALGKAGTIWIAHDYDSSVSEIHNPVDIILNGADLSVMANYALTIQGGWTETGTAIDSTDPLSEFHVPFKVIGWNAPVTINNISVNGVNPIDSPDNEYALQVDTAKGNITLNNVDVVDNEVDLAGAILTNNLAPTPFAVTVNNSNFNSNTATGLDIASKGVVTLKNVTANENNEVGAYIDNTYDEKAQAVNLTGTSNFNYNGADGLVIFSKGVITLSYITASYNNENGSGSVSFGSGAYLDNCLQSTPGLGACKNTFASSVVVKGINNFSYNGWDGLRVYSNGVISISNIIANNNGTDPNRAGDTSGVAYDAYGKGVYLDNAGSVFTKRGVNVTGTNYFSDNISNGLFIVSDGLIRLTNITANQNGCDQVLEGDTLYCAGVYLESYGGVTQTGYAQFVDNDQDGIRITTYNVPVTLTNVFSADNGNDGVEINGGNSNPISNITLNGINTSNNNGRYGMWIYTSGAITLTNVTANYNANSGLILDNTLGLTARPITIKGVNTFQGNGDTGLTVYSRGAITTYSINSVENLGQAAVLDNCDEGAPGECQAYPAATYKNVVTKTHGVSMLGTNYLNGNGNGLVVDSRGVILITHLTSIYSNGEGAVLNNNYANAIGGVTISGNNNISHNSTYGLEINSYGAISIANMTANYNNISGVEIDNTGNPLKPANVSFTGTNRFNDNIGVGLIIYSHGAVTLYNITANGNGDPNNFDVAQGVYIDNATGTTAAKSVVLYGYNYFNDNNDKGLYVISSGAITVQRPTANNNNGVGVYLYNVISSGTQAVTVSGYGVFLNNAGIGLQIQSNGKVVASNLTSNDNSSHGVSIDTQYGASGSSAVDVVISGYNYFNDNAGNGLQINNDGAITLTNIFASLNSTNGVFVDNLAYAGGTLNKAIVFNGVNNFYNNSENGLEFNANGNVTFNRLTAFGNDFVPGGFAGSGIVGLFGGGGTNKTLTFNCGMVMGNETFGMDITGATVISLKSVMLGQTNDFHSVTPTITRACPLP